MILSILAALFVLFVALPVASVLRSVGRAQTSPEGQRIAAWYAARAQADQAIEQARCALAVARETLEPDAIKHAEWMLERARIAADCLT